MKTSDPDLLLIVVCVLAYFCLSCTAKVGRHESINDLFTDEETFHYTQEHVDLRADIAVDQDAAEKAFRYEGFTVRTFMSQLTSSSLSQES